MEYTSGYDENKTILKEKVDKELSVLPVVFADYVTHLRESGKTDNTILLYLRNITSCMKTIIGYSYMYDNQFYEKITEDDIKTYLGSRTDLGVQAQQTYWTALNSLFSFIEASKLIAQNPMRSISRPVYSDNSRNLNYLKKDELQLLIDTIRGNVENFSSLRNEIIVKMAVTTGIELCDLLNLNCEHIDFSNSTIHVINKKGERQVPVSPSIMELLNRWIDLRQTYFRGTDTSALFISQLNRRLSIDSVQKLIRNACDQANIRTITYKDLKSTMVYLLAKESVSMTSIMDLLGTSDYLMIAQAYDAGIQEKNVSIDDAISLILAPTHIEENRSFIVKVNPPVYSRYETGNSGFTIYIEITNKLRTPIRLKFVSCYIYTEKMLRNYDYNYTGYIFDDEIIFPNSSRTIGKIWVDDRLTVKQLQSGDYLVLTLIEVESNVEHQIKYNLRIGSSETNWELSYWYKTEK